MLKTDLKHLRDIQIENQTVSTHIQRYFDLDCKLLKEEVKYLLSRLNECESTKDQSLRLAKYKDKRREYKSLIKKREKKV